MDKSISIIKGVGEKTLNILKSQNIETRNDLYLTLPSRYIYYELEDPLLIKEDSVISFKGKVSSNVALRQIRGNLKSLIFSVTYNNTKIKVLVFGREYLRFKIKMGMDIILYGNYKPQEKEIIARDIFFDIFQTKIDNIYPISNISAHMYSKLAKAVYDLAKPKYEDLIPLYLREKYKLLEYNEYLYKAHFPLNSNDIREVMRRKKYEGYLKYLIKLNALRYYYDINKKISKEFDLNKIHSYIGKLPFMLTPDQLVAIDDVFKDMSSNNIMNRLVQGDVGCGKSIVAIISALANYYAGYQTALMVPSEVLSLQHYITFKNLLKDYDINIELLNSSIKQKEKKIILENLKNGTIDIIIGTQSLLYSNVEFKKLGLAIIDEQHRFGVNDRSKLIEKGKNIDSLFFTATPIPRTLGISKYGDLDISSIHTMPEGRKKVLTKVIDIDNNEFVINAINKNVSKGHQVFVVCPKINESEESDILNVSDCKKMLKDQLPDISFEILHGGMSDEMKNRIMERFKNNEINVLISTTVIEVGIDIRNATLMVIYNAERFGLSSLHQLRGRVGRNEYNCGCILVTKNTMCDRLKVMEEVDDCFELSEYDLKLRGPGDFLGNSQSGFMDNFIENDYKIYECAKNDSQELYENYMNKKNDYEIVKNAIYEITNIKLN